MTNKLILKGPKRVLLATDFSKNSKASVEYGISLYGTKEPEYVLFNTCGPDAESLNLLASINDILETNSHKQLDKQVATLEHNKNFENIKLRSAMASGLASEAVLKAAQDEKVDLIVMGTNGATTMYSMLMGSTAASVIGKAKCPVLIIPGTPQFRPPKSIVYAADLQNISNYQILNPLLNVAKEYQSDLMILNVMNEESKLKQAESTESDKIETYFDGYANHTFHPILSTDIEIGIEKFIKSYEPDMLAMVSRNGMPDHKSMTKEMISRIKIPLLVMPDIECT